MYILCLNYEGKKNLKFVLIFELWSIVTYFFTVPHIYIYIYTTKQKIGSVQVQINIDISDQTNGFAGIT